MARCSPAAECFSHFRPRGKLACHGYVMKHVWISAELRGGAQRIKRRLGGSVWQGIVFRPPETSRSLGTPQIAFQILIFNSFGKRFFFPERKYFQNQRKKSRFVLGFVPKTRIRIFWGSRSGNSSSGSKPESTGPKMWCISVLVWRAL